MAVMAASAIVAGGIALGKGIHGVVQKRKGEKAKAALKRSEYQQSEQLKRNLAAAESQVAEGMPQASYNLGAQQIERAGTGAARNIRSLQGGLAGTAGAVQSQADAFSNLISADASMREANRAKLANARTAMAGEEKAAFQYNEADPYAANLASAQAMIGAGQQNIMGAVDDAGAAAIGYMGAKSGEGGGTKTSGGVTDESMAWAKQNPELAADLIAKARAAQYGYTTT
jgi:hypothetical protein